MPLFSVQIPFLVCGRVSGRSGGGAELLGGDWGTNYVDVHGSDELELAVPRILRLVTRASCVEIAAKIQELELDASVDEVDNAQLGATEKLRLVLIDVGAVEFDCVHWPVRALY